MGEIVVALVAGLLFGAGLALSGMTNPEVVLGFLDIAGAWNPALLFVMAGAVPVTFLGYRLAFRRERSWFSGRFDLPATRTLDRPLLLGAALFGAGWGLAGYCPGPALASLPAGAPGTLVFLAAMLCGLWLVRVRRAGSER
ncbi:MAG: DUF6691 family protein [Rhodospirillaceae bacterium]